jgi:hypothetical protein
MIRMIKLFAMERLVARDLDNKRDDELKWVWRSKVKYWILNLSMLLATHIEMSGV